MGQSTASVPSRLITLDAFEDDGFSSGSRKIQIHLPAGYDTEEERYPTLYFTDGDMTFSGQWPGMLEIDKIHDVLVDEGLISRAIIVAVFNSSPEGRVKDLSPSVDSGYRGYIPGIGGEGGGLGGFYRMLTEKLKPYVDSNFRTEPEPTSTGIVGVSLGGLAAFVMAYDHPETFGLAGCMSSSLWWEDESTLKRLEADTGVAKTPVRFWLDAGGGEYQVWREAVRAYRSLEKRGWIPGDDLAGFFDYHANHDWPDFQRRIRDVLCFLLRRRPYILSSHKLVNAVVPLAATIDLRTRQRRFVGAEAHYTNGCRLTVPSPLIIVEDNGVATVDAVDPILLHPIGDGETTIHSNYNGHAAMLRVIGCDPHGDAGYIECRATVDPMDRPHRIVGGDKTVAHFSVSFNEDRVMVDVLVHDETIIAGADAMPGQQDSVGFCFDARPESVLTKDCGYDDNDLEKFVVICMSPGQDKSPVSMASIGLCLQEGTVDWNRVMPLGAKVSCRVEPKGYRATLLIPSAYLNERQDGRWRVFRLNVWVNNLDQPGGKIAQTCWHSDWFLFTSPIASGIFRRCD